MIKYNSPGRIPKEETGKVAGLKNIQKCIDQIKDLFETLETKDQIDCLKALGVGSDYWTCQHCGEIKKKSQFYVSTAPGCKSGLTDGCKDCATDIAVPTVNGEKQSPTKASVDAACYFLDKPMLESVWESSLLEAANATAGLARNNVWSSYIKNIAMQNYYTMTYKQSDNYTGGLFSLQDMEEDALPKDQEIIQQFEKNKNDTMRLLGYLPFEKEKLADQPFLYSQLIGFLDADENGNDDMMRISSIITIVRSFLQQSQIDDMIADLVKDTRNAEKNIATIKALQQMKQSISVTVTKLAEESCISLKHSKNAKKGENTWTGKIKRIKDLNLRQGQVNGFDINTCRGMQQVQEISDASIMKQLALDDSDWSDMVAQMRTDIVSLRKEKESYKEINRILLQENLDLKDYLQDKGLDTGIKTENLRDLYSVFSDNESEVESDESDNTSV